MSRQFVVSIIDAGHEFWAYNNETGAIAEVITCVDRTGQKYIATVLDGTATDTLLELPRY